MRPENGIQWFIVAVKNYVGFQGRAQRKEFWYFSLFNNVSIAVAATIFDAFRVGNLTNLVFLGLFLPAIAVGVRRLHDTNRSGWWVLLPIVNIVFWVQDSDPLPNRFGECPKESSEFEPRVAGQSAITMSKLDQLERLAELRDKGILTSEEFTAKKASLL